MVSAEWTSWRPLRLVEDIPAATLAEQMDGGQAFRWSLASDGSWVGVFGCTLAAVRSGPQGLEWRGQEGAPHAEAALRHYLDAEGFQARLSEALPWRTDPVLRAARAAYPGLRILRQNPHEALIGFLCSSNKRILQIRVMVAALATKLGEPLGGGFHALPSWQAIAAADDTVLRACSLGYRAAYLRGTAKKLLARPHWPQEFAALPTADLLVELQSLPGVGPKVAACVALFGFGRLESFPVDTWVVQALADAYGLRGWKPAQLEQFGRAHFGEAAGLAQQYLFSAARAGQLPRAKVSVPSRRPRPRR
ncbi:MAG: DNA-binding protein [Opitutia bacterium]|nr:DNA-binding protein [Opitutales bacterium]PHX79361.1 MAG: DNA-binding protein [Opitutae bacterium]